MTERESLNVTPLLVGERLFVDTYKKKLGALKRFSIRNLDALITNGKLPEITSSISQHILEILLNEGQPEKIKDEYFKKALRLLDEPLGDNNQRIAVFFRDNSQTGEKDLYLAVYSQEYNPGQFSLCGLRPDYELTLPAKKGTLDFSRFQANDWERGKHYWPVYYSEDLAEQKGFFQILQRGVKDLLSVLPQQTKVPEVFNRAFESLPPF